ncbi:MAG: class I SAM-dependent methyltransferase [Acidobacteria bacterium]|nr:class I SAM-dependent methyltransferase [Acidobacteriota bacterium]
MSSDPTLADNPSSDAATHKWGTQPEMFGPRHEHRLAMLVREIDRLPRGSRVLDAAVGLGQLSGKVRRKGMETFGVDASFEAALYATRSGSARSVVGDLTSLPFRNGVFDGVMSGETLEHLDDDAAAVSEISRVLGAGGRCVATVPAMEVLWTASDDYYEHRRRYSRSQLSRLFEQVGLSVSRARYWGFPIVLIYDTIFLLPKNLRRARLDVGSDPALKSIANAGKRGWLVRLVRSVFRIDTLFSFIPFGPGLLLVAEKLPQATPPRTTP